MFKPVEIALILAFDNFFFLHTVMEQTIVKLNIFLNQK